MRLSDINHIYFLGIGGIGMSAIARYFHMKGVKVSGYDRTHSKVTNDLEEEGINISYSEDPKLIHGQPELVVWTPAIKTHSPLYQHFNQNNIPIKKRAEVLGILTKDYKTIAVAGTHGKTTVSTLVSHIFNNSDKGCCAFLGGISSNLNSNFLFNPNTDYCVVEADEFDRSFLHLSPFISIITSCDADHLDIYKDAEDLKNTFAEFAAQTHPKGVIISKKGLSINLPETPTSYSYDCEENADYTASNILFNNGRTTFNLTYKQSRIEDLLTHFPGLHNIENATAAIATALWAGIPENQIKDALASFKGIHRRFEYIINQPNQVFIDDYAHHPEELKASIRSVKSLYPGKRITGIFQPHLYSRTRDFADEFAESLSLLDELFLLPIYPAREEPIEGVSSEMLYDKVVIKNKKLVKKGEIESGDLLKNKNLQVLITLGAGDISSLVEPLRISMLKNSD